MHTNQRDDALEYKKERAIHGLRGIFWALNVLTDRSVDILRSDQARANGIAYLIVAGETLTNEIADQF